MTSPVQKFLKGFREQGKAKTGYPDINAGTGTEQDLQDYATEETIAASRHRDDPEYFKPDGEGEPVRVLDGVLDFLGDVTDEVTEWVEREAGEGHRTPGPADEAMVLRTSIAPPSDWKAVRWTVREAVQVIRFNDARRMVRLVNYGPELVYVSSKSPGNLSNPVGGVNPQLAVIPVSDGTTKWWPVEFETSDDMWAVPATNGTASILEVTDFFGVPEK